MKSGVLIGWRGQGFPIPHVSAHGTWGKDRGTKNAGIENQKKWGKEA